MWREWREWRVASGEWRVASGEWQGRREVRTRCSAGLGGGAEDPEEAPEDTCAVKGVRDRGEGVAGCGGSGGCGGCEGACADTSAKKLLCRSESLR